MIIIFLMVVSNTPVRCQEYKTLMIAEVFRHGAATNYDMLSCEDKILSTMKVNESLPNGLRQQYILGNLIYESYDTLFRSPINGSHYSFLSSSPSYCIESAHSHMLGLFGNMEPPRITLDGPNYSLIDPPMRDMQTELNFSTSYPLLLKKNYFATFPVFATGTTRDFMFFPEIDSQCSHIREESAYHYANFEAQNPKLVNDFHSTLENAGFNSHYYFGKDKWDLESVSSLFKYTEAYMNYFGVYPNGMTREIRDEARILHMIRVLNFYFSSPSNTKIYTSYLANQIMDDLVAGMKGDKVYSGFSVEEHTLLALMVNLKVLSNTCYLDYYHKKMIYFSDPQCVSHPELSSNLIFELSAKEDLLQEEYDEHNLMVRILYDGHPLEIPFCKKMNFCSLSKFRELVDELLTVEYVELKCGVIGKISTAYYWTLITSILSISLILAAISVYLKWKHHGKVDSTKTVDDFISAVRTSN